ncbi:multidrug effflux MFS transporter [Nitratireductor basaltis]|uniref:Bcr/CflA family efflux transporter n=1 Tax=Nitratireductor basaltis TaxID=472175 RepID=A0A084UAX5_9HYPH|nr:multidrug effflux MFS transporter [Nitratireductor basaltis]KFB10111.1 Bcr/CflA subfamily drug resistance transporter [Nitratireductor basaltis]
MSTRVIDRTTPPHILTLVIAAATAAVSMNVFLPVLPEMATFFAADYAVVQLAVSLYLGATAILQLFIGPASDRFGRRPVMLFCFSVFVVSTLAAIFAPTIEILLALRICQAFSAAGMVLSRAIVRDMVEANEAASRIGYVTMGMTAAPMVGPLIGGILGEIYGWQAPFYLMLGFGLFALTVVYLDLGETNHTQSASLGGQFRNYPELFKSRRFWGYSATAAFTSGAFFAFLGGGPFVATELLGLSPSQYGMYFALITFGYMIGNYCSGRFSARIGINRMMLAGNLAAICGMVISLLLFAAGFMHALALFGPSFLVGLGNGITLPNANAGVVSVRPHLAGSASGLGGALQIGGGAALSVISGALLSVESGPFPLVLVMLGSAACGILATLYVMRIARIAGDV